MRDGEKMTHCMPVCISKGISKREAPPHKKKTTWTSYVFVDVRCVLWLWQGVIYSFPLPPLHTSGSFTFMVIQIMKLSIRGILRWEQWTQLPPAACEMGWQTLRQMGEAALRPAIQSHSSRLLPVSPVHVLWSNLSTGRGQENLGSLRRTRWFLQTRTSTLVRKLILRGPLRLLHSCSFCSPAAVRFPCKHTHHTLQ